MLYYERNCRIKAMIVIELPDEQAAALTAKAAAEGLLLKDWLGKLAGSKSTEAVQAPQSDDDRPIWEIIVDRMKDVPPEDMAALPKDGASQIDHYVYGLPKRDQ
jgi:hypothetical protein